mmetsp:Transcript_47374/g.138084  ORF Transcript_47374/g.138084 Transcript_47374/m.138084 type:complete len:241 (+) Transcript_47374:934-1656(+)
MSPGLQQHLSQPSAIHRDEGGLLAAVRVRHEPRGGVVDRRVQGGEGVGEGEPWQRDADHRQAQTLHPPPIAVADEGVPVCFEDLDGRLPTMLLLKSPNEDALRGPRLFRTLKQRGQAHALANGVLGHHMPAGGAGEEPILEHEPAADPDAVRRDLDGRPAGRRLRAPMADGDADDGPQCNTCHDAQRAQRGGRGQRDRQRSPKGGEGAGVGIVGLLIFRRTVHEGAPGHRARSRRRGGSI